MPVELHVPFSINPEASDSERSRAREALVDALETLRAGVLAEGRATEYELFLSGLDGTEPVRLLAGSDVDSLEHVFVREVWDSEQTWQTHRAQSEVLAEFRLFKATYASIVLSSRKLLN